MRKNPVLAVREQSGMSRVAYARQLRVGYATLYAVENGYQRQVPQSILDSLTRLGLDAETIAARYTKWRLAQSRRERSDDTE